MFSLVYVGFVKFIWMVLDSGFMRAPVDHYCKSEKQEAHCPLSFDSRREVQKKIRLHHQHHRGRKKPLKPVKHELSIWNERRQDVWTKEESSHYTPSILLFTSIVRYVHNNIFLQRFHHLRRYLLSALSGNNRDIFLDEVVHM